MSLEREKTGDGACCESAPGTNNARLPIRLMPKMPRLAANPFILLSKTDATLSIPLHVKGATAASRAPPAGGAIRTHGFYKQMPRHLFQRPAFLPGELLQEINSRFVQASNDKRIHWMHSLLWLDCYKGNELLFFSSLIRTSPTPEKNSKEFRQDAAADRIIPPAYRLNRGATFRAPRTRW